MCPVGGTTYFAIAGVCCSCSGSGCSGFYTHLGQAVFQDIESRLRVVGELEKDRGPRANRPVADQRVVPGARQPSSRFPSKACARTFRARPCACSTLASARGDLVAYFGSISRQPVANLSGEHMAQKPRSSMLPGRCRTRTWSTCAIRFRLRACPARGWTQWLRRRSRFILRPTRDVGSGFSFMAGTNTADAIGGSGSQRPASRTVWGRASRTPAVRWAQPGGSPQNRTPRRTFQSRRGSLEHVFTVSPSTVNTFSSRGPPERSLTGREGSTAYPAVLGLAGRSRQAFPRFHLQQRVPGYGAVRSRNVRNVLTWKESLSTRRRKHNLRVAAQYSRTQANSYWPLLSPSGNLTFSAGLTSLPGITNTGHGFASFLLGMAGYGERSVVGSPSIRHRSGFSYSAPRLL